MVFNTNQRCGVCGSYLLSGLSHVCGGTVTYPHTAAAPSFVPSTVTAPITLTSAWNGPVCFRCNQGYLGTHDCDLIPIPCPDGREGCRAAHYAHKPLPTS